MYRPVAHLKAWNEEHKRGIWRGPYSLDFFHAHAPSPVRVLDVGCGTGRYTIPLALKKYDMVGADISPAAVKKLDGERMRRSIRIIPVLADACYLPFADHSFDTVICFGVLQHLMDNERTVAVSEFERVLMPGGILVAEVLGREDMRASGRQVEPFTFQRSTGSVYHYFDVPEIRGVFQDFDIIDVKEDRKIKKFKGKEYPRHMISIAARPRERDK